MSQRGTDLLTSSGGCILDTESSCFLLPPLTRRGMGPGMVIVFPDDHSSQPTQGNDAPAPALKWAEEGYTVIEILESALKRENVLRLAIEALARHDKCAPNDMIGLVAYGYELWEKLCCLPGLDKITAAVVYAAAGDAVQSAAMSIPMVQHLCGRASTPLLRTTGTMQYEYPDISSQFFPLPSSVAFDYATEGVAHTRSLTFLKKHMNGPFFDLEAIWEEHTYFEFDNRSVEHTMNTMVQEPYVNHIPTMTGGIGRTQLTKFYRDHFIFKNPRDTENTLISRTIGIDRVVDEFIMTLTHDSEIDWLIPGIPPTGRKLEIPFMAVVNIRRDHLYHEHIAWDQATVLRQLGLMPEYLPYPYQLPEGKKPACGRSLEVRAPVAGAETAAKMRDKNSVPSNQLFQGGIREARH